MAIPVIIKNQWKITWNPPKIFQKRVPPPGSPTQFLAVLVYDMENGHKSTLAVSKYISPNFVNFRNY